jgi:hypothetical protein
MTGRKVRFFFMLMMVCRASISTSISYHPSAIPSVFIIPMIFNIKRKQLCILFSLTTPTVHLSFPFESVNKHDRPLVLLPSANNIIDQTQNRNRGKHNNRPVEGLELHRRTLRPEAPKESVEGVQYTTDVDGNAPFAERPAARGKEFGVCDPAVEDGADGEDVGYHEGYDVEGNDCRRISDLQ